MHYVVHVDQLVAHLFTRHVLQSRSLGLVLTLGLTQVRAEVDAALTVLYADLYQQGQSVGR